MDMEVKYIDVLNYIKQSSTVEDFHYSLKQSSDIISFEINKRIHCSNYISIISIASIIDNVLQDISHIVESVNKEGVLAKTQNVYINKEGYVNMIMRKCPSASEIYNYVNKALYN